MVKLLPMFFGQVDGIDVVKSAMAEQFEKCVQWYVFILNKLSFLALISVTVYHNTKKSLKDELLSAELQAQDTQRLVSFIIAHFLSLIFYFSLNVMIAFFSLTFQILTLYKSTLINLST